MEEALLNGDAGAVAEAEEGAGAGAGAGEGLCCVVEARADNYEASIEEVDVKILSDVSSPAEVASSEDVQLTLPKLVEERIPVEFERYVAGGCEICLMVQYRQRSYCSASALCRWCATGWN